MTIIPIESDEQWHALRQRTIGGSEIGIVMGCSPYGTLNELFHVKRGTYQPNFEGNKLMQWGQAFEPVIATLISGEMHWELKHCRDYHIHPDHPHLGATLDYYVVESEHGPGILEIKNVSTFSPDWTKSRAPAHVELQIQHQFLVVNAARAAAGLPVYKWGAIGSLHAGNPEDVRIMYRKPDGKAFKHIIEQGGLFWDRVISNDEPDLMSNKELEHITSMYKDATPLPEIETMDRQDDPVLDDLIMHHEMAKQDASEAKRRQDEYKAKILHRLMGIDTTTGVTRQVAARTKNYGVETKLIEVTRKAQPAKTTQQLRFKIRGVD